MNTQNAMLNQTPVNKNRKVRILSIDGGGIRGIIPATVLNYMEQQLQEKSDNPDARLADYFDLIAGTSTGGILTCAYLTPQDKSAGRPMTAKEALDLYLKRGDQIFKLPFFRRIRTAFGLAEEKYSAKTMERLLKKYFKTKRLADLIKPCMVTAYDITQRKTVFFNKLSVKGPATNYPIWQVARATSAAPTYFEPALIQAGTAAPRPLIDGGVFANNPAMCAYIEAHKTAFKKLPANQNASMPDYPDCSQMILVSIGTGSVSKPYTYEKMKNQGAAGWIKPVIDVMMSSSAETVDFQVNKMFETDRKKNAQEISNYHRLSPGLGAADSAMDNVKSENLSALHDAGRQFVKNNQTELDQIVDRLMSREAQAEVVPISPKRSVA